MKFPVAAVAAALLALPAPGGAAEPPVPQRCPPPGGSGEPPSDAPREALAGWAVHLEQAGRFDKAGQTWTGLIQQGNGEARIAWQRRVNALAEVELALADLAQGKFPAAQKKLRSAWVDLQAQAKVAEPQSLPVPLPVALALARAEGQAPNDAPPGNGWWGKRLQAKAQVPGLRILSERLIGEVEDEWPVGVAVAKDGSQVVVAVADLGEAGRKLRAWGLEASGRRKWAITRAANLPGGGDDIPRMVLGLPDGTWVVGGDAERNGTVRPWLARLDSRGFPKFDVALPGAGFVSGILPRPDGTLLVGTVGGPDLQALHVVGPGGHVLWTQPTPGIDAVFMPGPKGAVVVGSLRRVRLEQRAGQWQALPHESAADEWVRKCRQRRGGKCLPPPQLTEQGPLSPQPEVQAADDQAARRPAYLPLPRGGGLRVEDDARPAALTLTNRPEPLLIHGEGPWRLAWAGKNQWLLLGTVAVDGCRRDVLWLRGTVGK